MGRRPLQGRAAMQEPRGRSPIVSPGKVDRPSKRRVRCKSGQRGPGAAKQLSDNGLGRWADLTSVQAPGGQGRAGRFCARQVKVAGHRAQPGTPCSSYPRGVRPCEAVRVG